MQDSDNKSFALGDPKGFALYDDVASVVPDDLAANGNLNGLFSDIEGGPEELLDEGRDFVRKEEDSDDLADVDLTPGALDKGNDSVRVYLREMGMVPLLTREGEIELARHIERGETAVRKALSRSRLIVQILLEVKDRIEQGSLSAADVLQPPDLPLPGEEEEVAAPQREQLLEALCGLERMFRKAQLLEQKLGSMTRNIRPKPYRKVRYEHARLLVAMSRHIRGIAFSTRFLRSLTKELKRAVDALRPLEQEVARLQRKLEQPATADSTAAGQIRRELKSLSARIEELEDKCGAGAAELRRTLHILERGEAETESAKKRLIEAN